MSVSLIADRYARAVIAAVTEETRLEGVLQDLRNFAASYSDQFDLHAVLENPSLPAKQRRAVIAELLDRMHGDEAAKNVVLALFDRGRLGIVPLVVEALQRRVDNRLRVVRARVVSATQLSEEHVERIREGLERRSGKTVRIETELDPELYGGVIVHMDGTVIDGSLRSRLERIKTALLAEE